MFSLSSLFLGKGKKRKKNSFLKEKLKKKEKLIPLFFLSLATRLKAKWTAHMFCTVENKFFPIKNGLTILKVIYMYLKMNS